MYLNVPGVEYWLTLRKRNSLPHLQSVMIVLWKALFANVSALVAQSNGQNGIPNNLSFSEDNGDAAQGKRKVNGIPAVHLDNLANGELTENDDITDPVVEELNSVRMREITSKAISGVLLILLKWFKLSRELSCSACSVEANIRIRCPQIRIPNPITT